MRASAMHDVTTSALYHHSLSYRHSPEAERLRAKVEFGRIGLEVSQGKLVKLRGELAELSAERDAEADK